MPCRVKSLKTVALSALLLLVIRTSGARADSPGNLQLIAAMPAGTESVLIYRYGLLTGENSVLRDDFLRAIDSLGQTGDSEARNEPLSVILRHVAMSRPVVYVEGGAEFTTPDGLGVGNYKGCSIWITTNHLFKCKESIFRNA